VTLVCWRNRWNLSSLTLPAQVAGVRFAEVFGVLSKQADEEVDAAEVAVAQPGQPGPHFRFDLDLVQTCHASNAICIGCYSQAGSQVPEAM
jgi:hypothetical protein